MEETQEHEFYIVRTAPSREEKFLDNLQKVLSKREDHGIYAIFRPETVKGYVFVEAQGLTSVVDLTRGAPGSKGVIKTPIQFAEVEKYFEREGERVVVNERDIVEVVSGPFKGDKAKVVRIVPGKDEIVIEVLNVAVPIPITLNIDDIRVVESAEEKKNE